MEKKLESLICACVTPTIYAISNILNNILLCILFSVNITSIIFYRYTYSYDKRPHDIRGRHLAE